MSGNKIFLDTNILLYLLGGDRTIAELLNGKQFYISFITQLELLCYSELDSKQEEIINDLLSNCVILDINDDIKSRVINLRKTRNLKLPDCIIIASSLYLNLPLITADEDFKKVDELNLILYEK
jgi:predicted nucleic acid-binding protein